MCKQEENNTDLASLNWTQLALALCTKYIKSWRLFKVLIEDNQDPVTKDMEWMSPPAILTIENADYNLHLHQAINGPCTQEYYNVTEIEFYIIYQKIELWDIVDRHKDINVLYSTWNSSVNIS